MHIDLLPYATDFHTKFLDTCYHGLIIKCFSKSNIKLNCHQSLKAAACLLRMKSDNESRDEYQNNISHEDTNGEGSKTSTTVILIPKTDLKYEGRKHFGYSRNTVCDHF